MRVSGDTDIPRVVLLPSCLVHLVIAVVAAFAALLGLVLLGSHIDVCSLYTRVWKRETFEEIVSLGSVQRIHRELGARIATPRLSELMDRGLMVIR